MCAVHFVVLVIAVRVQEPNPPTWPSTVHVFGPNSPNIDSTVQALYADQNLYKEERAALFFKPGVYENDIKVGYYTTVHGLGAAPEDVTFRGKDGVHQAEPGRNLIQFWRGVENLANRPSSGQMVWSVSQAAPLRRMIVDGDLLLGTTANTQGSGGYVSGVKLSGMLNFTMQQQWITRNCAIGERGISYFQDPPRSVNFIYVGTTGAPPETKKCTNAGINNQSPSPQQLVTDVTPLSIEKPYITIDEDSGKYNLVTPRAKTQTSGVQWSAAEGDAYTDGFEAVFVATNATAVADINAKLALGLHVILTPGIYYLPTPLRIGFEPVVTSASSVSAPAYQVLMGIGLATLVPLSGGAAVEVGDAPGVRVAGLLLQAGPVTSKALISVGTKVTSPLSAPPTTATSTSNHILIADVYARVGGPGVDPKTGLGPAVSSTVMMELNATGVVLDNVWLWRADVQNQHRIRDCNHSLVVNGHNVTAYGLAAEHTQADNTVWNGEGGRVFIYPAELDGLAHSPGDKTPDFGPNGVSGYRVNAKEHMGVGVGV
jgi:hypothetical protein